jgi:hypothetical protein
MPFDSQPDSMNSVLPLPATMICANFKSQIEGLTTDELKELVLKLQRENLELRLRYHQELGVAYGVIPYLEQLG